VGKRAADALDERGGGPSRRTYCTRARRNNTTHDEIGMRQYYAEWGQAYGPRALRSAGVQSVHPLRNAPGAWREFRQGRFRTDISILLAAE
jgi:hypothetical protein